MRTLLIDADIVAYQASASNQQTFMMDGGGSVTTADIAAARDHAAQTIEDLMDTLKADDVIVCLSDDFNNFRKDVDPTYKAARATTERPVHLYDIKDWLFDNYPCDRRRYLEADDVMGILSTEPHDGERIIVSADKDMLTIPGLLYRPHLHNARVQTVTLEDADWYHLFQTLIGDATDGYPGCPGVGPVTAREALCTLTGVESYEHTFASGPRKGISETRWRPAQMETQWDVVVSLYRKAGLQERHAIRQARLARILRHEDYNGRAILWSPQR